MQRFGYPLTPSILDGDGVILVLIAGFGRNSETAAQQLYLPTTPIRDYLTAVHSGARHSITSLPEAIQVWWPVLSQRDHCRLSNASAPSSATGPTHQS
jgi:hypothetical protein